MPKGPPLEGRLFILSLGECAGGGCIQIEALELDDECAELCDLSMEGGICTCDEGGGGKFGGALGEIMAFPPPPILMGDIVAAEFLGDT